MYLTFHSSVIEDASPPTCNIAWNGTYLVPTKLTNQLPSLLPGCMTMDSREGYHMTSYWFYLIDWVIGWIYQINISTLSINTHITHVALNPRTNDETHSTENKSCRYTRCTGVHLWMYLWWKFKGELCIWFVKNYEYVIGRVGKCCLPTTTTNKRMFISSFCKLSFCTENVKFPIHGTVICLPQTSRHSFRSTWLYLVAYDLCHISIPCGSLMGD